MSMHTRPIINTINAIHASQSNLYLFLYRRCVHVLFFLSLICVELFSKTWNSTVAKLLEVIKRNSGYGYASPVSGYKGKIKFIEKISVLVRGASLTSV